MNLEIKTAQTDSEIASCWKVMQTLRPHLKEEDFVGQIRLLQSEGYILKYIEIDKIAVALAGFRIKHMLFSGKMIYIDDLATLEESRGKGYANILLQYIDSIAKDENCTTVQLDSASTNFIAHKVYLKNGFDIKAFHFIKNIDSFESKKK